LNDDRLRTAEVQAGGWAERRWPNWSDLGVRRPGAWMPTLRLCGLVVSKPRCCCCRFCYCCLSLASSINSLWISRRVVWRASILLAKSSSLLLLSSILFAVVGRFHVSILYWRCRSIDTTASERIVTGRRCALVVLPIERGSEAGEKEIW